MNTIELLTKKEGKMAQKTVKKTAAKATATKKAPVKKAAVKKAPAKKTPVKKTATAATAETKIVTPASETFACGCGNNCACGGHCGEHHAEHTGGGFGRFIKKLIIVLIIFALGFAAAKMLYFSKPQHMRHPRAEFVNGCLDVTTITCPKMMESLTVMDVNSDNCISRDEYRAFMKQVKRASANN